MEAESNKDYITCKDVLNCEKYIDEKYKNTNSFYGYLIENDSFDYFLLLIGYNKFLERNIDSYFKKYSYVLEQTKFNSAQDLFKTLNNKKFRLINYTLYQKVCLPEKKNEPGMMCHTQNKDTLIIDFGNKQYISFNKNNNIIEKSSIKSFNFGSVLENKEANKQQSNEVFKIKNEQITKENW